MIERICAQGPAIPSESLGWVNGVGCGINGNTVNLYNALKFTSYFMSNLI